MVAIARRIHLYPCRTQKLSFLAPRVVGGRLPARVGRCHAIMETDKSVKWLVCFCVDLFFIEMAFSKLGDISMFRTRLDTFQLREQFKNGG